MNTITNESKALMDILKLHACEKSEGKIMCLSIDKLGIRRCGYCGERE